MSWRQIVRAMQAEAKRRERAAASAERAFARQERDLAKHTALLHAVNEAEAFQEEEREERARLKEEKLARQDFEREQARLEKERTHYETALRALRANGDSEQVLAAEEKLNEINRAIEGIVERAANARAGYVYVISNVGSFGTEVVKIGLTRRLDPLDRVRELGDASVPFRFDVHAIIFSEDAVALETALHRRFARQRVNLVNSHREFFYVSPHLVKEALVQLQGSLLSYVEVPEALEWHQSNSARHGA